MKIARKGVEFCNYITQLVIQLKINVILSGGMTASFRLLYLELFR